MVATLRLIIGGAQCEKDSSRHGGGARTGPGFASLEGPQRTADVPLPVSPNEVIPLLIAARDQLLVVSHLPESAKGAANLACFAVAGMRQLLDLANSSQEESGFSLKVHEMTQYNLSLLVGELAALKGAQAYSIGDLRRSIEELCIAHGNALAATGTGDIRALRGCIAAVYAAGAKFANAAEKLVSSPPAGTDSSGEIMVLVE